MQDLSYCVLVSLRRWDFHPWADADLRDAHLKDLKAFQEEFKPKKVFIVSLDRCPRQREGIEILPWQTFLEMLWRGEVI